MVWILLIGALIAIVNVVLTGNELMPFLRALTQLNRFTDANPSISNRIKWLPRFISILPKAFPLLLDIGIAVGCMSIGLSGGVYGALIGLSLGFTGSILWKIYRHLIQPKMKIAEGTWKC